MTETFENTYGRKIYGNDFIMEIDLNEVSYEVIDNKIVVKINSWDGRIGVKTFDTEYPQSDKPDYFHSKSWKTLRVGDRGGIILY